MSTLKFGALMPAFGPCAQGNEAAETQRVLAQRAESLGFDSLWLPDHVVFPTKLKHPYPYTSSGEVPLPADCPMLDVMVYLSYIAGVTRRIRLGTSVMVLPNRNPILSAKMLASLDVLSGGRTILGAGAGYMEEEITLLGAPFDRRGAYCDEAVKAMRELWSSRDPVFQGEFVSFADIKLEPKPLQTTIPIWFGGHSRRMMRRVAELGQGCIFNAYDFEQFQLHYGLLKEEADKAQRDFDSIAKAVFLSSAFSVDATLAEIERYRELGLNYFIVLVAAWGNSLPEYFAAISEFAHRAGMKPAAEVESAFFK